MIKPHNMDDYTAVLLARSDCRNDPVALQVCDMFLAMYKPHRVTFADKSHPEGSCQSSEQ